MHTARSSQLLPLPTDNEETHETLSAVLQVLTSSKEQLQFLLVNDSEKNTVSFSCNTNLQFLSFFDVFCVDGTCKSVLKFFQLLKIHGLNNGHYVPFAFSLPANQHQACCEDVFRQTV